ncbi:MAG: biotin--[acetyl-CoA-carboxylase] ligase [Rikenellaceae bacterium]
MSPIYKFQELESTNSQAQDKRYSHGDIIWSLAQSKGRGQKGNKWDSAPGENLTFTLILEPENIKAREQFSLLEALALGVVDLLAEYQITAQVKWTNDIYVGDKKICGILIDNDVCGDNLSRSIVGIGLNVNQEKFSDWVPNPTSIKNLTAKENNLQQVLELLYEKLAQRYQMLEQGENQEIHKEYHKKMYLLNKWHEYTEANGTKIYGRILGTETNGELKIELQDGQIKGYMFKEISF